MSEPKFKVGDKVMLKKDHHSYENNIGLGKNLGTVIEIIIGMGVIVEYYSEAHGRKDRTGYVFDSITLAASRYCNYLKKKQ